MKYSKQPKLYSDSIQLGIENTPCWGWKNTQHMHKINALNVLQKISRKRLVSNLANLRISVKCRSRHHHLGGTRVDYLSWLTSWRLRFTQGGKTNDWCNKGPADDGHELWNWLWNNVSSGGYIFFSSSAASSMYLTLSQYNILRTWSVTIPNVYIVDRLWLCITDRNCPHIKRAEGCRIHGSSWETRTHAGNKHDHHYEFWMSVPIIMHLYTLYFIESCTYIMIYTHDYTCLYEIWGDCFPHVISALGEGLSNLSICETVL